MQYVEITVEDTGIGVPAEKFQDIFKSFEQVDASIAREYGGSGLGLSITKQLIELHGGTIRVESEMGKGSRFIVRLPVSSGKASNEQRITSVHETHSASSEVEMSPRNNENPSGPFVLVVDDEPVNRQVLSNLLGVRDYRVVEARNGEEALALVISEKPDTVLLDIMMPKMNGYEVCRKIRETNSQAELPIIFLSAKNQVEDLVAGMESGGNDYLPKPFSTPELLARVKTQTNLKASYAEAIRLRGQLLAQEKMATVGSMAAGIVHDFKNPVSVIKGFAELADDDSADPGERREYLRIIGQEADRLASMAQDVLDYTRGTMNSEKQLVNLPDFLARAELTLKPYFAEKNLRFSVKNEYSGKVSIDPDRFLRVLINIAGNAADALESGGEFEIRARKNGKGILFELKDNGPGIPEAIRETLFEPFVTHGKSHGTGLGMAITRSIVEAHGGSISFETNGQGTTFLITLMDGA